MAPGPADQAEGSAAVACFARHQVRRVLRGRRLRGGLLGLPHQVIDLIGDDPGARDHPDAGGAAGPPVDGDHRERARGGDPVGGERVPGPAQVGGRRLVRDHDGLAAGPRGRQGALDGVLRRFAVWLITFLPRPC